jgi:hypothetical protein
MDSPAPRRLDDPTVSLGRGREGVKLTNRPGACSRAVAGMPVSLVDSPALDDQEKP